MMNDTIRNDIIRVCIQDILCIESVDEGQRIDAQRDLYI